MSVIAVTSSRTSPGATTLATGLALVWSHRFDRSLFVEADSTGGVQSLRFDLKASPSLATFGSDVRNGFTPEALWANTQDLRGAHCLSAPVDPRISQAWVERVTPALVDNLGQLGAPVVIDLGLIGEHSPSVQLCAAADTTLIVTRPEIAEIQALLFQVKRLQAVGASPALVCVGARPNDPIEVAHLAGIPLAAVLPDDATVASALVGAKVAPQKVRRSLLWRTISGLADTLVDRTVMAERHVDSASDFVIEPDADAVNPFEPQPTDFAAPAPVAPAMPEAELGAPAPLGVQLPPPPGPSQTPVPAPAPTPPAPAVPAPAAPAPPAPAPPAPAAPAPPAPAPAAPVAPVAPIAPAPPVIPATPVAPAMDAQIDATSKMHAQLVDEDGNVYPLPSRGSTVLGRHRSADIVVDDARVSRRHGCIEHGDLGWRYRDLESSNGSRCNGHRISDVVLTSGDHLRLGHSHLRFELVAVSTDPHFSSRSF